MRLTLACIVGLFLLTGCGHVNTQVEKINVDGTTCVKAQSGRGIAVDCDWNAR